MSRLAEFGAGTSYAEKTTQNNPRCVNCNAPLSIPGVDHPLEAGGVHHFWSESPKCIDEHVPGTLHASGQRELTHRDHAKVPKGATLNKGAPHKTPRL